MIKHRTAKTAMFKASLQLMPPLVRHDLLADRSLARRFGVKTERIIAFGGAGISFHRSSLFAAVRRAATQPARTVTIVDQSGTSWAIATSTNRGTPSVILRADRRLVHAAPLILVTHNKRARSRFAAVEIATHNLPKREAAQWRALVGKRPLKDDELDKFVSDCVNTPVGMHASIRQLLSAPKIAVEDLVPKSEVYYERLVGRVDGQQSVIEYIDQILPSHIASLITGRKREGLRWALLLGAHPQVADVIDKVGVPTPSARETLKWAATADVFSRATLFELFLRPRFSKRPIGSEIRALLAIFCGTGKAERYDQFELASIAFTVVYGEFARCGLLVEKPVFWRRLAALAHSALIVRSVMAEEKDLKKFIDWMKGTRPITFTLQCSAELRSDPRWLPHFVFAHQLKQECYGRVLARATVNESVAKAFRMHKALLGSQPNSVKSQVEPLLGGLPGPLEGNVPPRDPIPAELLRAIRTRLADSSPSISSFGQLLNIALLVQIPQDVADAAAAALKRAQHRIDTEGRPEQLYSCLLGLASVAAVTRSRALAEELLVTIRTYRRWFHSELEAYEAFRIGLVACANRAELTEWCKCVGTLIADLGFGELTREDAAGLYSLTTQLCELVPELWATCGQGLAAMEAVTAA